MKNTILIIMGNVESNNLITRELKQAGYFCVSAESVMQAFDRLRVLRPDAMILEFGLPDGIGIEILRYVRTQTHYNNLPIITITGQTHAEAVAISQYKPEFVLPKPANPDELIILINHQLPNTDATASSCY